MTNLFAVKIEYQTKPYIFCVSDSQSTAQNSKNSANQKLIIAGNNLVMATGRRDLALETYEKLEASDLPPKGLSEAILQATEEQAAQFKGDKNSTTLFFVAGNEGSSIATYEVSVIENEIYKRCIVPFKGAVYSQGSGAAYVNPELEVAANRKGHLLLPTTPLEAIAMCFGVGQTADRDLAVNDKLQIGFVSLDALRLLIPPGLILNSYQQINAIYKHLTGIDFALSEKSLPDKLDEIKAVSRACNAFYHALQVQMARIKSADLCVNFEFTKNKARGLFASKAYKKAMKDLAAEKAFANKTVDAFMSGSLDKLVEAARAFQREEEKTFAQALKIN